MEKKFEDLKLAERGATVSIVAYIGLSILKLGVGHISGSKALFADGLNNATDILSSVAVLIGLKIAGKPADDEHAYGHFRAETLSSLIASLIMIAVGIQVLFTAVRDTIFFEAKAPDLVSAITAIFCAGVIFLVYRYNFKLATKINSSGLMAAAKDNLSDAYVSIGTAVGILASQFGFPWIDPLVAAVVGYLIIKTGWDIFNEAAHNLTDGFDKELLDQITASVDCVEGVRGIEDIKARIHGNTILMDLVILVDPHITVLEGHDIAVLVELMLLEQYDISQVIIHIEPNLGESNLKSKMTLHEQIGTN